MEDDLDSREMYQLALQLHRFDVVTAADGPAAIEAARRARPDAIVTDYTLPGMDGLALARHFRDDPWTADSAVLLLSGHRFVEAFAGAGSVCDAALVKPVLPDDLASAIGRAIVQRTAARLQREIDRVWDEVAGGAGTIQSQADIMAAIERALPPGQHRTAAFLADDEACYVGVNEAACALTARRREELVGASVWDLTPGVNVVHGLVLWKEFVERGTLAGPYSLSVADGPPVSTWFAARAHLAPNLHLSLLEVVPEP